MAAVLRGCVAGYRQANPGREIRLDEPGVPVVVLGAPDLLAQLVDKLVDNALGFARPGTPVTVALARHGRAAALSVENQGPPLPEQMIGRLFESMVSIRPAGGEREPHLGIGLYIVRLIAAFHGGEASARDRDGGDGVIVTVSIPLHTDAAEDAPPRSAAQA
jgi:signal transduction histidine kinase